MPLLRRLPVTPADEYRARFEIAFRCGFLVLAAFSTVQLLDPPLFSVWSYLDAIARFVSLFVFVLSLGTSLGWRTSNGLIAELFSRWELLFLYFIPQLADWIWTTGNDVYYGLWVWEPLKKPFLLFANGLLWLVIHWRRAAHGTLLPHRFTRVISSLLFFAFFVSFLRHNSVFAWLGKKWRMVHNPEVLSPTDLNNLLQLLWVLPVIGACLFAFARVDKWKRVDVLLSRLPCTPQAVARARLAELVWLWVALFSIPAFLHVYVVARYPWETAVVRWELWLVLSLAVLASVVLFALLKLLASLNSLVAFLGLGLLALHLWVYIFSWNQVVSGSWNWPGPLGVSLLELAYTAIGMWMVYWCIQQSVIRRPTRWLMVWPKAT